MAWTWLGASMAINDCPHGLVCAPGQRYHPAIIAQSIATLQDLFGDRLWVSFGTGQAINESITGVWPEKEFRKERLLECVDIMKRLWSGELVNHTGRIVVQNAKLFSNPKQPPLLLGAALTDETADWVSGWADGLITVASNPEDIKNKKEIFLRTESDTRPIFVKLDVAFDSTKELALLGAHDQWSTNTLGSPLQAELSTPGEFEEATATVKPEDMEKFVFVCTNANGFAKLINDCFAAGADKLIVHNVTRQQDTFLNYCKEKVFPNVHALARR